VENLYECVLDKGRELQTLVTQPGTTLSALVPRVRTNILHLRSPVLHLKTTGPSISNFEPSCTKALYEQLASIEQLMTNVEELDRPVGKPGVIKSTKDVSTALASVSNPPLNVLTPVVQETTEFYPSTHV
jgi:hypothetical protein